MEDGSKFYQVTVIDHSGSEFDDIILKNILQTGGENYNLISDEIEFYTDRLITGLRAEECIQKLFSEKFLNRNCHICVGEMKISTGVNSEVSDENYSDDEGGASPASSLQDR
ncbi:unnamed protein product [Owenia fusiformis]|uniref:Uncharacterized protein n=1 Tax=Owenia fusiformis TaxID=6347 RepID=A0A8S4P9E8_OWEFU|nr:unnamed protein product [Owenia fusiformis]